MRLSTDHTDPSKKPKGSSSTLSVEIFDKKEDNFLIVEQSIEAYGVRVGGTRGQSLGSRREQGPMANGSYGADALDSLRTIVAATELEISRLPQTTDGKEANKDLRASWSALVKVLALEPARETRQCPSCKTTGMRDANRCGNCWAKLEPLAKHAAAPGGDS